LIYESNEPNRFESNPQTMIVEDSKRFDVPIRARKGVCLRPRARSHVFTPAAKRTGIFVADRYWADGDWGKRAADRAGHWGLLGC
jgi:hypothetical protein